MAVYTVLFTPSIFRILAMCTQGFCGQYAHILAQNLSPSDSIITFNWDLLMDQELYFKPHRRHYNSFQAAALQFTQDDPFLAPEDFNPADGLFLKMHGSMNWFQCTNKKCPASRSIISDAKFQDCLLRLTGLLWADESCTRCGSSTEPLIIPPLLQKPIADSWVVRSAWGLARKKLQEADVAVVIGFSAPPTDFYASWLLRSTVGSRPGTPVFVVNPGNDNADFQAKMRGIFPRGYSHQFRNVAEMNDILTAAKQAEREIGPEGRRQAGDP
jgi:hypothetical protein